MGHFIIGICRMAGFNALRNTYRPLASTTIADFYNRVYYYFKELLVDFFFYPTYFRYFKDRPRLRLFFATLAAAGFGNLLYHILASIGAVSQIGLWRLIVGFHVYAIYAMILGLAIGISQIRSMGRPPAKSRLVSTLGVVFFYCLIMVLDSRNPNWSIADYGSFLVNLFIPFPR
jgi:D-alanyl-lipoteichoic acid acyltransferase DltB (MBOAT superfamily)